MNEGIVGVISVAVFLLLVFVYCVAEDYYKSKAQRKYDERLAKYDTNKKRTDSM
jgi:hypothetical protein